jgi:hypothetical protein
MQIVLEPLWSGLIIIGYSGYSNRYELLFSAPRPALAVIDKTFQHSAFFLIELFVFLL